MQLLLENFNFFLEFSNLSPAHPRPKNGITADTSAPFAVSIQTKQKPPTLVIIGLHNTEMTANNVEMMVGNLEMTLGNVEMTLGNVEMTAANEEITDGGVEMTPAGAYRKARGCVSEGTEARIGRHGSA